MLISRCLIRLHKLRNGIDGEFWEVLIKEKEEVAVFANFDREFVFLHGVIIKCVGLFVRVTYAIKQQFEM